MRVTLHIDDATLDEVRELLGRVKTPVVHDEAMTTHETTVGRDTVIGDAAPEAVRGSNPAIVVLDEVAVVDAKVAEADGQWPRVKTVGLKAGGRGEVGSAVRLDDGREGVIEAAYRGRAVVVFEDGSTEIVPATTMTLDEAPKAEAEPVEAPEAKDALAGVPTTVARFRRQVPAEQPAEQPAAEKSELAVLLGRFAELFDEEAMLSLRDEFGFSDLEDAEGLHAGVKDELVACLRDEIKAAEEE